MSSQSSVKTRKNLACSFHVAIQVIKTRVCSVKSQFKLTDSDKMCSTICIQIFLVLLNILFFVLSFGFGFDVIYAVLNPICGDDGDDEILMSYVINSSYAVLCLTSFTGLLCAITKYVILTNVAIFLNAVMFSEFIFLTSIQIASRFSEESSSKSDRELMFTILFLVSHLLLIYSLTKFHKSLFKTKQVGRHLRSWPSSSTVAESQFERANSEFRMWLPNVPQSNHGSVKATATSVEPRISLDGNNMSIYSPSGVSQTPIYIIADPRLQIVVNPHAQSCPRLVGQVNNGKRGRNGSRVKKSEASSSLPVFHVYGNRVVPSAPTTP